MIHKDESHTISLLERVHELLGIDFMHPKAYSQIGKVIRFNRPQHNMTDVGV